MPVDVGLRVQTFFSPDDDTQGTFLRYVQETHSHLRIAIYGLHLPPLIEDLLALHKGGKDVALVIDHTQAHGTAERPEVEALRQAGVPLLEGTSDKHRILHHKFAVRDKSAVLAGSWNFSEGASLEDNYFDIVENADRATLFLSKWQEMHDWIAAHEAAYNAPQQV